MLPKQFWFGLFPVRSPLLGESFLFSLPGGNEMFQFPPFASLTGYMSFTHVGCPIRKSTDQSLFAASRSLSQLITSFFASESLGIRHAPLLTFFLHSFKSRISHTVLFPYFLLFCFFPICQRSSVIHESAASVSLPLPYLRSSRWWRITDSNR